MKQVYSIEIPMEHKTAIQTRIQNEGIEIIDAWENRSMNKPTYDFYIKASGVALKRLLDAIVDSKLINLNSVKVAALV